jgi:hypothetical protein
MTDYGTGWLSPDRAAIKEFPAVKNNFPVTVRFPVLLLREISQKNAHRKGYLQTWVGPKAPELVNFPVFFPVTRELLAGDGFDSDCVRHQPLSIVVYSLYHA